MIHIESNEQYYELIKSGRVLVDFYATWCGPCSMLAEVFEDMEKENLFQDVSVVKVNVDEYPAIAASYGIQSIPTLFLFENGQLIKKSLGYLNQNQVIKFISK